MLNYDSFGLNIKKHRERMGITQQELAEKMFVSFQAVSAWERGVSLPDLENASRLADILNVKLDALLEESNVNFLIAIDGGGTKTEFILFEANGAIRKRIVLESTNPNIVGLEKCLQTLYNGIDTLCANTPVSQVKTIFAGISGVSTGDYIETLKSNLSKRYGIDSYVDTDGINMLSMAHDPKNAAIVICGTGSSVFVRKNYEKTRIGGWGYLFDQPGSAYSIGNKALCHALAVGDRLEKPTVLSQKIEEKIGGKAFPRLSDIYEKGISYIASLAPIVVECAENGDTVSKKILEKDASDLARLINHAQKEYGAPDEFLCAGGFLENKYFRELLCEKAKTPLYFAENKQIYGASLECMRLAGIEVNKDFKNKFNESYR